MITPFEHRVKTCIEAYQRLRIIHEELNAAARDFKSVVLALGTMNFGDFSLRRGDPAARRNLARIRRRGDCCIPVVKCSALLMSGLRPGEQ